MAVDDLDRISGLKTKPRYRAALAELGIATGHQLVLIERERIVDALRKKNLRASLEDVAVWQDQARRLRTLPPAPTGADWEQVGGFVVSFEQRAGADAPVRRLVVDRTEDNGSPVAISTEFAGWDCGMVCSWMRTQLAADELEQAAADATPAPPSPVEPDATLPRLRVTDVQLVEGGEKAGVPLDAAARELVSHGAGRLVVRVDGAPSGTDVEVALRRRRANAPSEPVGEPVVVSGRTAELELIRLGEGVHDLKVAIQALGCVPAVVLLAPLVIRPAE